MKISTLSTLKNGLLLFKGEWRKRLKKRRIYDDLMSLNQILKIVSDAKRSLVLFLYLNKLNSLLVLKLNETENPSIKDTLIYSKGKLQNPMYLPNPKVQRNDDWDKKKNKISTRLTIEDLWYLILQKNQQQVHHPKSNP